MDKPPYIFRDISHFSVGDVKKRDPRIDYITKLTLEIGSRIPHGRQSLVLIKPFPPLGREGKNLSMLKSLCAEDIETVYAFRSSNGEKRARIEIHRKAPGTIIFVKCELIEGVPGWDEKQ